MMATTTASVCNSCCKTKPGPQNGPSPKTNSKRSFAVLGSRAKPSLPWRNGKDVEWQKEEVPERDQQQVSEHQHPLPRFEAKGLNSKMIMQLGDGSTYN